MCVDDFLCEFRGHAFFLSFFLFLSLFVCYSSFFSPSLCLFTHVLIHLPVNLSVNMSHPSTFCAPLPVHCLFIYVPPYLSISLPIYPCLFIPCSLFLTSSHPLSFSTCPVSPVFLPTSLHSFPSPSIQAAFYFTCVSLRLPICTCPSPPVAPHACLIPRRWIRREVGGDTSPNLPTSLHPNPAPSRPRFPSFPPAPSRLHLMALTR